MPHRVEDYVKISSLVDFKYLFQHTNINANTYKDIMTRELGGFHHCIVGMKLVNAL
jgi:hypothetical protein